MTEKLDNNIDHNNILLDNVITNLNDIHVIRDEQSKRISELMPQVDSKFIILSDKIHNLEMGIMSDFEQMRSQNKISSNDISSKIDSLDIYINLLRESYTILHKASENNKMEIESIKETVYITGKKRKRCEIQ